MKILKEDIRKDLKWKIGDRVKFIKNEFTFAGYGRRQDAWIGDTGTIIDIHDLHFCEEDDWQMWFDIEIDRDCLKDKTKDRWCKICTADRYNAINLTKGK